MTEIIIDERIISGTGLLRIPQDVEKIYTWAIYVDVIREPTTVFKSNRYSPPRQRFATLNFLRDGYVVREETMDYARKRYMLIPDVTAQTLLAVKCSYQGVLQSFVNLATALSLPVISVTDLVKDMPSLNDVADSVQIRCENDTALQVRLYYRQLTTCNDESVVQPPPPPPPPPIPPITPGQPINNISPPYDEDDTITSPDPLDDDSDPQEPIETPFGATCEVYEVRGAITSTDMGREERVDLFYGVIEEFVFVPGSTVGSSKDSIIIRSRGLAVFEGQPQPCGSPIDQIFLQVNDDVYVSHELISITPQ